MIFGRFILGSKSLVFVKIFVVFASSLSSYTLAKSSQTKELSSTLSLKIFLDNYDIWSNEAIRLNSVNTLKEVAPIAAEIEKLNEKGEALQAETDVVLERLSSSISPSAASLEAAIVLSQRRTGVDKVRVLRRAYDISSAIGSSSEDRIAILIWLAQTHLEQRELGSIDQVRRSILAILEKDIRPTSGIACLARGVVSDISFFLEDFEFANDSYEKTAQCLSEHGNEYVAGSARLELRRAWTSFRLTQYDTALRFLESATTQIASEPQSVRLALNDELAKLLGVALSEVAPSVPSSHWVKNAQENGWVALGLVNAILYLSQSNQDDLALRWLQYLEASVRLSAHAADFYAAGVVVHQKSGRLDQLNEWRMRAIIALKSEGLYARSQNSDFEKSRRRSEVVLGLAREVFEHFSGLRPEALGRQVQLRFADVVDVFLSERASSCSDAEALLNAHRFISLTNKTFVADRINESLENCNIKPSDRALLITENLEMHRRVWKSSNGSDNDWQTYKARIFDVFRSYYYVQGVRLIALEAAGDGLSARRFADSESLVDLIFTTSQSTERTENRQFEHESLTSLTVHLLAHGLHSHTIERLGWDMHSSILPVFGRLSKSVMELEGALAAAVYAKSLVLRKDGQLVKAVGYLSDTSVRFGSSSSVGRDMKFMATRLACESGLEALCLSNADVVLNSAESNSSDQFFAYRWRASVLWQRGSVLRAADSYILSSKLAVSKELNEFFGLVLLDLKRAGSIYSDLFLWDKVLEVRVLLGQLSPSFKKSTSLKRNLLMWTGRAIKAGAFEVAAELASGAYEEVPALAASGGETLGALELHGRLFAGFARYRSHLGSVDELDQIMEVIAARKRRPSESNAFPDVNSGFISEIVSDVVVTRRKEILNSYRGRVAQLNGLSENAGLSQMRRDFERAKLYCKLSVLPIEGSELSEKRCLSEFAQALLSYSASVRHAYSSTMAADAVVLESDFLRGLNTAERQFRSLLTSLPSDNVLPTEQAVSTYEHRTLDAMELLATGGSR